MIDNELYLNWKLASDLFHCSRSTFNRRVDEIEEWIRKGRYPKDSIIHDSSRLVARTVYTDYLSNRKALADRMVSKHVKPFESSNYEQAVSNLSVLEYLGRRGYGRRETTDIGCTCGSAEQDQ